MLETIRFLEQVGRDQISAEEYVSAVASLDVSDSQRQALRAGDHAALVDLLGARTSMFFGVFAPEEEPMDVPAEDRPEEPLDPDQA